MKDFDLVEEEEIVVGDGSDINDHTLFIGVLLYALTGFCLILGSFITQDVVVVTGLFLWIFTSICFISVIKY